MTSVKNLFARHGIPFELGKEGVLSYLSNNNNSNRYFILSKRVQMIITQSILQLGLVRQLRVLYYRSSPSGTCRY